MLERKPDEGTPDWPHEKVIYQNSNVVEIPQGVLEEIGNRDMGVSADLNAEAGLRGIEN